MWPSRHLYWILPVSFPPWAPHEPLTSVFLLWLFEIQMSSALCELLQLFSLEMPSSWSLSWSLSCPSLASRMCSLMFSQRREGNSAWTSRALSLHCSFLSRTLSCQLQLPPPPRTPSCAQTQWGHCALLEFSVPGQLSRNGLQQNIVGLTSLVLSSQKPQSCTAFCSESETSD